MAGALDGAVAAPFSTAGGMAASAITSTATKVGTIVAVEAAGGDLEVSLTVNLKQLTVKKSLGEVLGRLPWVVLSQVQ